MMTIYKIRDNLKNTIRSKERYLSTLGSTRDMNTGAAMAVEATRLMLEINVDELKKILADVEEVCKTAPASEWLKYNNEKDDML